MKIKCEKCEKDLNKLVDRAFFDFSIGYITCFKCQKHQSRVISSADLYLYLLLSEIYYLMLTGITLLIYQLSNQSKWTALLLPILLFGNIYIQQITGRQIYQKAFFKKQWANVDFKEDGKVISKGIRFRILIFFSVALALFTLSEEKSLAILFVGLSVAETFIKYLTVLNKEKKMAKFN